MSELKNATIEELQKELEARQSRFVQPSARASTHFRIVIACASLFASWIFAQRASSINGGLGFYYFILCAVTLVLGLITGIYLVVKAFGWDPKDW